MQVDKAPYAWVYREFDTNGRLRAEHVWTFIPTDIKQYIKNKDVHHVDILPLYLNESQKQTYNKDNKYDAKKLVEAYGSF
jgi:hypothetical protein